MNNCKLAWSEKIKINGIAGTQYREEIKMNNKNQWFYYVGIVLYLHNRNGGGNYCVEMFYTNGKIH